MLHKQIKDQIKEAMLAKQTVRLGVLRGLSAAFTNELVALKKKPNEELPDENCLNVIKRLVKQRKESIDQFRKGGREDLVKTESDELVILETYLPATLSKDEIRKVAEAKKVSMNVTDKTKMGMLMGAVMKELKGNADGGDVKEVVESLFK